MSYYNNQKKTEGDHITPEPEEEEIKQDIAKVALINQGLKNQAKKTCQQSSEESKSIYSENIHLSNLPVVLESEDVLDAEAVELGNDDVLDVFAGDDGLGCLRGEVPEVIDINGHRARHVPAEESRHDQPFS